MKNPFKTFWLYVKSKFKKQEPLTKTFRLRDDNASIFFIDEFDDQTWTYYCMSPTFTEDWWFDRDFIEQNSTRA